MSGHRQPSRYTQGCRCGECRDAWRLYPPQRAAGERWRRRNGMRPAGEVRAAQKLVALVAGPRHTHGKRSTYVRGCRCDDCRAAHAAYERARKAVTAPGEAKVRGPSQRGATRKR